jgi:DNA-directed RNA polymerase sigma subunit (sigma70/sigma32)
VTGEAGDIQAHLAGIDAELDTLEVMPGGAEKTGRIRVLAATLQGLYERATRIRAAEMLRIRDEEGLSLSRLAERVGVSKARADQILRAQERRGPR